MREKPLKQEEIIENLKGGFELGRSNDWSGTRYWMQKKLCCGGDSFKCHASSVRALVKKGVLDYLPKKKNDPFWLERIGLNKSKNY